MADKLSRSAPGADTSGIISELKNMANQIGSIINADVSEDIEEKTQEGIAKGIAEGTEKGIRKARKNKVNLSEKIEIDTGDLEEDIANSTANAINNGVKKSKKGKKVKLDVSNQLDEYQNKITELNSQKNQIDLKIKTDSAEKATQKINNLISSTQGKVDTLSDTIESKLTDVWDKNVEYMLKKTNAMTSIPLLTNQLNKNSYKYNNQDILNGNFAGTAEITATQLNNVKTFVGLVAELNQYYKAIGKQMPKKYFNLVDNYADNNYLFGSYDDIDASGRLGKQNGLTKIESVTKRANDEIQKSTKEMRQSISSELSALSQEVSKFVNKELKALSSALSGDVEPETLIRVRDELQKLDGITNDLSLGKLNNQILDLSDKAYNIADGLKIDLDTAQLSDYIQKESQAIKEETVIVEENTTAKKENNNVASDNSEVNAIEKEADAIKEETAIIEANTEAKKENAQVINDQSNIDVLLAKAEKQELVYEDVLGIMKEIASISEQISKHTLDLQGYKYEKAERDFDTYGVEQGSDSIEHYQNKLKELYKLYKNVQSAIKNNGGMFKGEQYGEYDLEQIKFIIGAIVENIAMLGGNIDETIAKIPKMTKEFKEFTQETAKEASNIKANNDAYMEEEHSLDRVNHKLVDQLYTLERIVQTNTNPNQSVKISDVLDTLGITERDYSFGDIENKAQRICQILGIELPQASEKAEQSIIEETQKISTNINEEVQSLEKLNQVKKEEPSLSTEDIAKRELITNTILESFEAQKKYNQAKKEEPKVKADDSSNLEKLVETKREFAEINEKAAESAIETSDSTSKEGQSAIEAADMFVKAAEAKREFVEANKLTEASAEESVEALQKEAEAAQKVSDTLKDGIYNNQRGSFNDNNFSYTRKSDENSFAEVFRGRGTRDENGILTITEELTVDYARLKKEIIDTDTAIFNMNSDIQKMKDKGVPTQGLESGLQRAKTYLVDLEAEMERYYQRNNYLPGSSQRQDLIDSRNTNNLKLADKETQRLAESNVELAKKVNTAQQSLSKYETQLRNTGEYSVKTAQEIAKLNNELAGVSSSADLVKWRNTFANYQNTQASKKGSPETQQNKEAANAYKELLQNAKRYYELKAIESSKTRDLTNSEQTEINDLSKAWLQAFANKEKYYINESNMASNNSIKLAKEARDAFINNNTDEYTKLISKSLVGYQESIQKILASNTDYTAKYKNDLSDLYSEITKINSQPLDLQTDKGLRGIQDLISKCQDLIGQKGFKGVKAASETALNKFRADIERIVTENTNMGDDLKKKFSNLLSNVQPGMSVEALSKLKAEFADLRGEMYRTGQAGKNFFDTLKQRIVGLNAQFLAQYFSWQDWIRYIRQAAEAVVGLDSAITELRKVSDASTDRLNQSFRTSAETAQELGQTIEHVINVTADWARLGYNVDDAEKLAKATALFTTVGDNMTADDASSYLISTMQGFQIAADDAMTVIDKYNEVANNFAIDTAGIGEALKRSAASFNAANTDLSKSIALITATNTVTQDPTSTGTLWKTLSARIRGAKTELEELGEEEDDFTKTTSKLRDLVKSLTGFDIMKDENTFKDIYEIIIGIGKEWQNLTDIEQASLGEALAGKRNANALYAVLNNIDTLEAAYQKAEDSAGSAQREQENYAKSIQYSIDRFKASLEELSFDILDSQMVKGFIEGGNTILQVLDDIITKLGGMPALVSAAIGAFTAFMHGGINFDIDPISGKFMGTSLFGKRIGGAFQKSEITIVKDLFDTMQDSDAVVKRLATSFDGLSDSTRNYVVQSVNAGQSSTEIISGMQNANKATGILSSTLKSLGATILSTLATMAAFWAIEQIISLIYRFATATKNLNENISTLSTSFKETKNDINTYKDEIAHIYNDILNSDSSTLDERKEARSRLIEIQDQLISKYGEEKEAVDLITESINGEVGALDTLIQKKWEQLLIDIEDSGGDDWLERKINKWTKQFNLFFHGVTSNYELALQELNEAEFEAAPPAWYKLNVPQNDVNVGKRLSQEFYKWFDYNDETGTFKLKGNLQEIVKYFDVIRGQAEKYGASDTFLSMLDEQAANAKYSLESLGEFIDLYSEHLFEDNPRLNQYLEDVKQIGEKYSEAFTDGFKDTNEEDILREYYQSLLNARQNISDPNALQYIENLNPDISSKASLQKFKDDYKNNIDGLQNEIQSTLEQLKESLGIDLTYEDLINFNPNAEGVSEDQKQIYNHLTDLFGENDFKSVAKFLKDEKEIVSDLYKELSNIYGEEFISKLSPEQLEFVDSNEFKQNLQKEKQKIVKDVSDTIVDAKKQIQQETQKIQDWGLGDYQDQIINDTIQHKFGNVDMDNRSIIKWSDEYLNQWETALKSWKSYDEFGNVIGSKYDEIKEAIENGEEAIDTVYGGSNAFKLGDREIEVAYSPIMVDQNGKAIDFLSEDTVRRYIQQILDKADKAVKESGEEWTPEAVYKKALEIDLTQDTAVDQYDEQGNIIGSRIVKGIIAGIDNYTGEGGSKIDAAITGMLMHFVGDYGALNIATEEAAEGQQEFNNVVQDGVYTQEMYQNALSETIAQQNKLAKTDIPEFKFDPNSFSDAISKFKNISSLYSSWKSELENGIKIHIDYDELDTLRENFTELGLGDAFDEFANIVGNSKSSISEIENAFNNLGQVYIENSGILDNLTTETADLVASQLEGIGVTNSYAVVQAELAKQEQEVANAEALKAVQAELAAGKSLEDALACSTLAEANIETKWAVFELIAAEEIFGNTSLNVSGKLSQLSELASAYLGTANAALYASYVSDLQSSTGSGIIPKEREINILNAAKNKIGELADQEKEAVKPTIDFGNALGKVGSGGGSAAGGMDDATDSAKDASAAIDELQDAYSKLKKIQDSYNKTGKISVDEAQELMQMDFRYLAMLKNENGAISVNEQAFENLTRIKLEEMRVTMMRNALNTMQSITTEAQAEAYLALCTGEANMAATEAIAIQAALEAQMRGATGAIAEAYNMIYQGLQNAMAMLGEGFGNVDFSSIGQAANEATEGIAENAQEEFEKVYDWLERRMKVLQKKADLFAAKRANADRTFFSRTEGVNGLLNEEIRTYKQMKKTAEEQVKEYGRQYQEAIKDLDAETIAAIEGNGHGIQKITDQAMSEAIDKAIEWKDKLDDAKITVEEMQTKINDLSLEKFNFFAELVERKLKKLTRSIDFSEFYQGVLEAKGFDTSSDVYKTMSKDYGKLAAKKEKELLQLESYRRKMIAKGQLTEGSSQDLEMQDKIYELQQEILDVQLQQVQAERDARDAVYERFKYLQQIQDSYEEELSSINSLFYEDQAIDDNAHYTGTAYGMMATQYYNYESNLNQVQAYKQKLAELEQQYKNGVIGAKEYQDEEQEIRAAMYESAEAAKDAKDAIIDLAKERIEKEIDIIEEQIKSYQELINKQKEALKSAKDLHDYQKSIAESEKDIAKIRRQLAAIENDNSQAAIAKRRQLEEKLAEAQEKLEEKQYNHSVTTAEKALDKQAEAYEEAKNVEIERLQEKLKNVDALFVEATEGLNGHMAEAMEAINSTVSQYGVTMSEIISNAIITGAKTGTLGAQQYLSGITNLQGEYTNANEAEVTSLAQLERLSSFKETLALYAGDVKAALEEAYRAGAIKQTTLDKWFNVAGAKYSVNNILRNQIQKNDFAGAISKIDELIKHITSSKSGKSKAHQKKMDKIIKVLNTWKKKINAGYATGVHKLNKDEVAWTQEFGQEAILSPTRNAILTPLKSGDSVLTAKQTENLFKMAKDPLEYLKDIFKVGNVELAGMGGISMNIENVLTVQGDVNDSNAREMAAVAQQAITKAFNELSSKIKK